MAGIHVVEGFLCGVYTVCKLEKEGKREKEEEGERGRREGRREGGGREKELKLGIGCFKI